MEPTQSVNQWVHASFRTPSTSYEAHRDDMDVSNPHVEPSLVSNEMSSIETIQSATYEQQHLPDALPLCSRLLAYRRASDQQLLEAAKASDQRAFLELTSRSKHSLRHTVFRIVRNREDTEDVVQDTLLKAYEHLSDFRGFCSFSTWLTKIAINSSLIVLRRRKSRSEVPLDQRGYEEHTWEEWDFPDTSPNPEQDYAKRQVLELLTNVITCLAPPDRDILDRRHRQEQSLEECADAAGITVAAAKSRLLRARLKIRSALARRRICATDACF